MKSLPTLALAIGSLALSPGLSLAHVHPLVPADEIAPADGAANEAEPKNGENGQQFIPGFIPEANPGKADLDLPGPGVAPATEHAL